MEANLSKFQAFVANDKISDFQVPLHNDVSVKGEYDVKLFGVYVDSKLKFDTHTKYIFHRAAQHISVLCWYARLLDIANKLAIYISFVLCNSNYCPIVWNICSSLNKTKFEI